MATTDSPAHADPSAIRLTDYPSSESEQESSQVKKRRGEVSKRQVNKRYKSAEYVDSESDSADSPSKLRSTHTPASNDTTTPTASNDITAPIAPNEMQLDNYSWGSSASQPSRNSKKRPLPSPTRPAETKRVRRGPFDGRSDSESNGNDHDSDGEVGSPHVTAEEFRSESPAASPAKPAAAVQTGKKFNMSLFRKKAALKQKGQAGNTEQRQPQVDAKDVRATPARTTPAETSKIVSPEYSEIRKRGSSSVNASTSASTPPTAIPHAPVWDPQQMSAPKVFSRKVPAEESSVQKPLAKTAPVQEQPAQKVPARKTPAHRTSALRPSAQEPLFPLKKPTGPMKKPHEPTKIQNELTKKPGEGAKTESSKTDRPTEAPKTAAVAEPPKIDKLVEPAKPEVSKTDKSPTKSSKIAAPVEPPKIGKPVEPPKISNAIAQPLSTSQAPTSEALAPAHIAERSEVEPPKRSGAVTQPPLISQAPPSQASTPALPEEKSEAIAVQSEQDTVQPDQDVAQPDQEIEQPELNNKQRELDIVVPSPTTQAPDIPEPRIVQPEQDVAQPEQDVAQPLHDVAIAKPAQITVQPEQITVQPEQITVQPEQITAQLEDAITLPTPLLTPTASPFFEYTLHTSFSTSSHSTTFEHPTHPLTSAHATASSQAHFSHQTQLLSALGMQSTSSKTVTDQHGLTCHEAVFKNPYDPSKTTTLTYSVSRAAVGPLANTSPDTFPSFSPVISCEIYALRLWALLDTAPDSDDEPDTASEAAESRVRVYCPLPPVCTELHTTLDAANRAAKRVQVHLSHARETEKEREFEKQWRAKNLAVLNQKVEDLRKEVEEEDGGGEGGEEGRRSEVVTEEGGRRRGCWFSRFAGAELEEYELRVEPVGVSGPRNL